MKDFCDSVVLGSSGLKVRKLGIGADAGISAKALEWAFEQGINYFYWGSRRRKGMKTAIRNLAPRHREQMVIALQTYDYSGLALETTFMRGLKQLKIDYADVFILGMRNKPIPERIMDKALMLKEKGLARNLCVSAHSRSTYQHHLSRGVFDLAMVRYNSAHRGAEKDVFPLIEEAGNLGVICYNSTRWGHLFEPDFMPEGEKTPTPADLYRYVLSNPNIQMVLTAPETMEQLQDNVKALDAGPVSEEEKAWLERIGKHVYSQSPNANFDFVFQGWKKIKKSSG